MSKIELIQCDCLDKMKDMPDESVDAIATDPPYELGFMGKKWDTGLILCQTTDRASWLLRKGPEATPGLFIRHF